MVDLTRRIVPGLRLPSHYGKRVIIAASSNLNKFFFLDCDDGNVYVGTRNLLVDGEMMVCVPEQTSRIKEEAQDGMLRWLEWYAHCLQSGMFHVRTEEGSRSISLYPEIEPHCTTAVTRGVQVCSKFSIRCYFNSCICLANRLISNSTWLLVRSWLICIQQHLPW